MKIREIINQSKVDFSTASGLLSGTITPVNQMHIELMERLEALSKEYKLEPASTSSGSLLKLKKGIQNGVDIALNRINLSADSLVQPLLGDGEEEKKAAEEASDVDHALSHDLFALTDLVRKLHHGETLDKDHLALAHKGLKADVRAAIVKTSADYMQYCADTRKEFEHILDRYSDFIKNGSGISGAFRRYRKNYVYDGPTKQQYFINLIDMLALMDTSGRIIDRARKYLQRLSESDASFNMEAQQAFMTLFYDEFEGIQAKYKENRKAENEAFAKQLNRFYAMSIEDARRLVDEVLYKKSKKEILALDNTKINYDLRLLRETVKGKNAAFEKQIRELKKAIHRLCQYLGLHSRIIKVAEAAESKKREESGLLRSQSSMNSRVLQATLLSSNPKERPSVYNPVYSVGPPGQWKSTIPKEKQDRRRNKAGIGYMSKNFSNISSFGEGCVAAYGLEGLVTWLPKYLVMIPTLASGWFINRLLFLIDTRDCFYAQILGYKARDGRSYKKIFLKEDEETGEYIPVSFSKSISITVLGLCALFTGLVYAALNYEDCKKVLIDMFKDYLDVEPVANVISFLPALGIFINLSSIFFTVIATLLRNDQHLKVQDYLSEQFVRLPWKQMWQEKDTQGLCTHVGRAFLSAMLYLVTIGVTISFTKVSSHVLYHALLDFLSEHFSLDSSAREMFALMAAIINGFVTTPFQLKGTYVALGNLLPSASMFSKSVAQEARSAASSNPLHQQEKTLSYIQIFLVYLTATLNGLGQGAVNMSKAFPFSDKARRFANEIMTSTASALASAGPNLKAALEAVQLELVEKADFPEKKASDDDIERRGAGGSVRGHGLFDALSSGSINGTGPTPKVESLFAQPVLWRATPKRA